MRRTSVEASLNGYDMWFSIIPNAPNSRGERQLRSMNCIKTNRKHK